MENKRNVWLLPTDKPSRIYLIKSTNKLGITSSDPFYMENFGSGTQNQHIYITSDEEIKDGDYAYHKVFGIGKIVNINKEDCFVTLKRKPTDGSVTTPWKRNIPDIKKIILTTDRNLIIDGVQAIDDDFLEWFVNNPSCEFVEVIDFRDGFYINNETISFPFYKIIFPKEEEPKQEEINFIIKELNEERKRVTKKETLEEAKNKAWENYEYGHGHLYSRTFFDAFELGYNLAKEQDKNKYSEEDMIEFAVWTYLEVGQNSGKERTNKELFKQWFEQFKKK
jgi:hypothetical protein